MLIIKMPIQNITGIILIGKTYLSVNVFTKYSKYILQILKKYQILRIGLFALKVSMR